MGLDILIASLLKGGLSMLGNAVLAKGKDVIEQKLGVSLEDKVSSEAGLIELKRLEIAHEEFLIGAAKEAKEQTMREDQMYLSDRSDSRDLQKTALGQEDVFSKRFLYYFSIAWSLITSAYIGFITFATIPVANLRFVDTILGFLLGSVIAVMFQFFYGSSKNSQAKDEALREAVKGQTK